jgi:hypothetical protein
MGWFRAFVMYLLGSLHGLAAWPRKAPCSGVTPVLLPATVSRRTPEQGMWPPSTSVSPRRVEAKGPTGSHEADAPPRGAEPARTGAGGSSSGADRPLRGANRPFPGANLPLFGASPPPREADRPLSGANLPLLKANRPLREAGLPLPGARDADPGRGRRLRERADLPCYPLVHGSDGVPRPGGLGPGSGCLGGDE